MEFINPNMFWGLLAITIPIFLHFWHQKKSELLPWAATHFLNEKVLQQSRGFKLENILLLLLRCFLMLSLVFILVRPLFKSSHDLKTTWVFPDSKVIDAYKFEILKAIENGEKVFWLNGTEIESLEEIPNLDNLQLGINRISKQLTGKEKAEIYLTNNFTFFNYYVPLEYELHILEDSLNDKFPSSLKLFDGTFLKINAKGELDFDSRSSSHQIEGIFHTNIETNNPKIKAALLAIEKVYKLKFNSEKSTPITIHFLEQTPKNITERDLYFVMKNSGPRFYHSSVIYVEDFNLFKDSNQFLFPEFILEKLLHHLGVKTSNAFLTKEQVEALFSKSDKQFVFYRGGLNTYLICLFFIFLVFERWISIKNNQ